MAYGGLEAGHGVSSYDLDRLAAGIISGHVSTPLMTADSVVITTRDGEEIAAYYSRAGELQGIYAAISAAVAECLAVSYNLATDIIH